MRRVCLSMRWGVLARRMRTVRDLRRLMRLRGEPGEVGERDMDAVCVRLKELGYLSDTRFAADYTRLRKENEKFGRRRVQQDLMQKGVQKELIASTLATAYDPRWMRRGWRGSMWLGRG